MDVVAIPGGRDVRAALDGGRDAVVVDVALVALFDPASVQTICRPPENI